MTTRTTSKKRLACREKYCVRKLDRVKNSRIKTYYEVVSHKSQILMYIAMHYTTKFAGDSGVHTNKLDRDDTSTAAPCNVNQLCNTNGKAISARMLVQQNTIIYLLMHAHASHIYRSCSLHHQYYFPTLSFGLVEIKGHNSPNGP
jgi:hypothetical protein